jgi:CRISPR-associated protein Csa1
VFPRRVWDLVRSRGLDLVSPELRGWALEPGRYSARPSVSDVASPCPSKRDVYLRRVRGLRLPESGAVGLGRLVHEAFLYPFRHVSTGTPWWRVVESWARRVSSLPGPLRGVARSVFDEALGLAALARADGVPVAVEPEVPGGPVGLSDYVKPDLLVGYTPVEVVLAAGRGWAERKSLALAGYALAVEAWTGQPVDYAVIAGVAVNGAARIVWRVVWVDDPLRRRFIEERDRVARIIEYAEDPGLPPACPQRCPFRGVCHGEGAGG